MTNALTDLKLKRLYVVHAGDATFSLSRRIQPVALCDLLEVVEPLR